MSLNTRNKRRRELREERVLQDGFIFQLPDETLLKILKYFTTAELITAAGICHWFRTIAYDSDFWTTIDLTTKPYSNREVMKFLHRFPRQCTEVLKLSGGSAHINSGKPPPFTEQLNSLIHTSYPNLRYLHLSRYDFHTNPRVIDNITDLPANLQGLYLTKCEMLATDMSGSSAFLQSANKPASLAFRQLEILSFENSACLSAKSISYLPTLCPNLVELNLNGCFRIVSTPMLIDTLLFYSKTLRRLYLGGTRINDDTIHSLCRKLKRLNILDIKDCRHVSINIVDNLLTLKQLTTLIADENIRILYEQGMTGGDEEEKQD
ncbi:unnamed protein product [Adineta ricciae]|uniref:F-box domain-containing protein n=1 Tax=Adineta ricciae TaxID=249248 RepID=A0A814BR46_ADIRI|nr:unnamed protein product [Adineta ricciae]